MFQRLYNSFFLFKEYVVFSLLVVVSVALLSMNDNDQVRHIRSLAVGTIGALQSSLSVIPNIFALQRENEMLRRLNVDLADEVSQLREARLENMRLRLLIGLHETSHARLIAGKVIGKNLTLLRNTITLNVGSSDSVANGMPVVTGEGLVGRVIAASAGYAVVQIVFNVDFRASARVQRSRVDGIVAWDGRTLLLKNVARSLDVRPGDAVTTSEYSNAFPPAIKIGVVTSVIDLPNNLFKRIEVAPTVDFVKLEEAFVLDYLPSFEKVTLEEGRP